MLHCRCFCPLLMGHIGRSASSKGVMRLMSLCGVLHVLSVRGGQLKYASVIPGLGQQLLRSTVESEQPRRSRPDQSF